MTDFIFASLPWRGFSLKVTDYLKLRQLTAQGTPFAELHKIIKSPDFDAFELKNSSWLSQSKADHHKLKDLKCSWVLLGDELYPKEFYELKRPPLILSYKGTPNWTNSFRLSIVGSRRPSAESLNWLEEELPLVLRKNKLLIVSGGAIGIDQKAHSISLRERNPTLCFLPSGLEQIYPSKLHRWQDLFIAKGGCFISQFSPGQHIFPSHFHSRNQLIAAISPSTFIVEAKRRSGSLLTAKWAMELNRNICCLPSHPQCLSSQGSLDLIYDGAQIIRDHSDLLSLQAP